MRIIIGADCVPTSSNKQLFIDGNILSLLGEDLISILEMADFRIINLETPLCNASSSIKKYGPCLRAETATIKAYEKMKCDLVTIANNHIMDQDIQGLESTIKTLKKANIDYVGVGKNIDDACQGKLIQIQDKTIGIYACAEHEFSYATKTTPGANPFDPLESFDHVKKMKENCDFVIVLYHGGKEFFRYPSPYLQKCCQKFIEKGANLVICQHSHCIGCFEEYLGGTIIYGQGNFIFDDGDDEYWNTGLLIQTNAQDLIDYIPIVKQGNTIRLADRMEKAEIIKAFNKRSEEIKKQGFIEMQYHEFAKNMIDTYYYRSVGCVRQTVLFKILNKLMAGRLISKFYKMKNKLALLNTAECEAHRELFIEGLKGQIYQENNKKKDVL